MLRIALGHFFSCILGCLGPSGVPLGAVLEGLGVSGGVFGMSWRVLGAILKRILRVLEAS